MDDEQTTAGAAIQGPAGGDFMMQSAEPNADTSTRKEAVETATVARPAPGITSTTIAKSHGRTPTVRFVEPSVEHIEPSRIAQDYFDEDIFVPNIFYKKSTPSTANAVFQELAERYNEQPVSQADFFAPKELLEDSSNFPKVDIVDPNEGATDILVHKGRDSNKLTSASPGPSSTPLTPTNNGYASVPALVLTEPDDKPFVLEPEIMELDGPIVPPFPEEKPALKKAPPLDRVADKPVLKKAPPLDRTTRFLDDEGTRPKLRERRHSIVDLVAEQQRDGQSSTSRVQPRHKHDTLPTPTPWILTERFPKAGWSMKARCSVPSDGDAIDIVVVYVFNSNLLKKVQDREADLGLFVSSPFVGRSQPTPTPTQSIQRARTDIGRPQQLPKPTERSPERDQSDVGPHQRRRVNWLQHPDMLPRHLPEARVITVGFDIAPALAAPPDFTTAAGQLYDYLCEQRNQSQRRPVVFLGHTFGGMFILQMLSLSLSSAASSPTSVLSNTAGVFLFSCSVTHSEDGCKMLANLFGANATDNVFSDLSDSPMLQQLKTFARAGLFAQHPQSPEERSKGPPCRPKTQQKWGCIAIGFPLYEVSTRNFPMVESLSSFLGAPVRQVISGKDTASVLKFASSQDPDFIRMLMLIRSVFQTHRLLHAAAAGNAKGVLSLTRDGVNVNFRDRWSQTALQIAVRKNDEAMVLTLVEVEGIEVNVRDNRSNTPLHYAIRAGNETIIRSLLHHGADIGIENNRKRTPRDLAEKHKSRKHIAKLLKSRLMAGPDQSLASKRIGTGALPTSKQGRLACKSFQATVTEIYATTSSDKHWSVNISIEALLYGSASLNDVLSQVRPREVKSESPVCIWIHVPENNMIWLEDLFAKLDLHLAIWQDTRQTISESIRQRAISPHVGSGEIGSVFMSYLSYELNHRQIKRTEYVQDVEQAFRQQLEPALGIDGSDPIATSSREESRPQLLQIPDGQNLDTYPYRDEDSDSDFSDIFEVEDPDDCEEEEKALIKCYLNNPPSLHVRRTLDQYFYHMLESTKDRDIDQVVSRWAERVKFATRHNILMVDQLWLWSTSRDETMPEQRSRQEHGKKSDGEKTSRVKRNYVITCFPNRTGVGLDDLRFLVLDRDRRKQTPPIRHPEDLIARILETCCSVFDRRQNAEMLRFFQMFEDSIGSIDDKESQLFRDFQRGSTRLLELDSANKFYNEQKNALLVNLLDIREEIRLLVEIKDTRDEINIILSVLTIQLGLVEKLGYSTEGQPVLLPNSVVENLIRTDIDDFKKMDNHAHTIQDKLNSLMDLKQKAANAWEAREARETAVATGKQSNTLMVFTVVTIIFLPLSFMSSFFAIGISAFPRDATSGEVNWPLRTLLGILFGVSLGVSTPLIIFALNMDYCSSVYRELRSNYLALIGTRLIGLLPSLDSGNALGTRRKVWSERLRKTREDYLKDEVSGSKLEHDLEGDIILNDMKVGASQSFPSTVSSHTLVDDDDIEMLQSWRTKAKGMKARRLRLWGKGTHDSSLPAD